MILNIEHITEYEYDQPVCLGPHTLRLIPRPQSYKVLISRELFINPQPVNKSSGLECDGSMSELFFFNTLTPILKIQSRISLELQTFNPFDFIVSPDSCLTLPLKYPMDLAVELYPCLTRDEVVADVLSFARYIWDKAKGNSISFLVILSAYIKENFVYEVRKHGDPYPSTLTLKSRRGSCRDLTVLFIAVCQSVGFAARYVSGYYFDQHPAPPELHAWAEVYIPGAGWRGFDPTLGLACYGHHVVLTAGVLPALTTPIQGSFHGGLQKSMRVDMSYEYLDSIPT